MNSYWFIWKGKNSLGDFGLWVRKLPKRTRAAERYKSIEIPGRPGSLILTEGEDIYDAYSDEMVVSCKDNINTDKIIEWLSGSSDLILSDDINKARPARIVGAVKFDREIKDHLFVGTIPFLFQPFRKNRYPGQDSVTLSASGTIYNPGDVASRPVVSIVASGDKSITIGGMTMEFSDLSGTASKPVIVDCDAGIITKDGEIWTKEVSGNFWRIPKGSVSVTLPASTSITIEPRWRWK